MTEGITEDDLISLCGKVGKILLTSGAETSRVESTVEYIGKAAHYDIVCHATITAIFVGTHNQSRTHLVKVRLGDWNLQKVDEINTVSREFVAGEITVAELKAAIEKSIARSSISTGPSKFWGPALSRLRQCCCSRPPGLTWDTPFSLGFSATSPRSSPVLTLKRPTFQPALAGL